MSLREPILHAVKIEDLRPTQMTVGLREVEEKRRRWREQGDRKKGKFLGSHMIPVLLGPKERRYVIDHHHLALALHKEGADRVLTTVVADLRHLEKDAFWYVADRRGWAHSYDETGKRRPFSQMPKTVSDLVDDPYRSLAGELRRAGGLAKDTTPFSEFLWADFLRRRIARKLVEKDFDAALRDALVLARGEEAVYLPGWCGPHQDS